MEFSIDDRVSKWLSENECSLSASMILREALPRDLVILLARPYTPRPPRREGDILNVESLLRAVPEYEELLPAVSAASLGHKLGHTWEFYLANRRDMVETLRLWPAVRTGEEWFLFDEGPRPHFSLEVRSAEVSISVSPCTRELVGKPMLASRDSAIYRADVIRRVRDVLGPEAITYAQLMDNGGTAAEAQLKHMIPNFESDGKRLAGKLPDGRCFYVNSPTSLMTKCVAVHALLRWGVISAH